MKQNERKMEEDKSNKNRKKFKGKTKQTKIKDMKRNVGYKIIGED